MHFAKNGGATGLPVQTMIENLRLHKWLEQQVPGFQTSLLVWGQELLMTRMGSWLFLREHLGIYWQDEGSSQEA